MMKGCASNVIYNYLVRCSLPCHKLSPGNLCNSSSQSVHLQDPEADGNFSVGVVPQPHHCYSLDV